MINRIVLALVVLVGLAVVTRLVWVERLGYTVEGTRIPVLAPGYSAESEMGALASGQLVIERTRVFPSPGGEAWWLRARYALIYSWTGGSGPRIEVESVELRRP